MLKIEISNQFKKDYKLATKQGLNPEKLQEVLYLLVNFKRLPSKFREHNLLNTQYYKDVKECHIQPNWLLIYKIDKKHSVLKLYRTGTHSELFN